MVWIVPPKAEPTRFALIRRGRWVVTTREPSSAIYFMRMPEPT